MATQEQKRFVTDLLDKTSSAQWVAVVRFGLGTLLEDQVFLVELICSEADRRCAAKGEPDLPQEISAILASLGLRLASELAK